tara:strand:- start:63 stop:1319 length:1257 start_codon:yes stop_codon:yes gene_type:complete
VNTMQVELLNHQHEMLSDRANRLICLAGGYGSGKTSAGVHFGISRGFENDGMVGIWVEPTHQLIKRVAIPEWIKQLDALEIPYMERKADLVLVVGFPEMQFEVHFYSGTHPERIVGQSAAWAVLDEAALLPEMVFRNVLARVRDPRAKLSQIACVTTPEGFNWVHERFVKQEKQGTKLIRAKTSDNPFLPPEYLDSLREQYTEQEFEQYCNGEFVAMSGAVYSRFDRAIHCKPCHRPLDGEIVIGADFNIGKMVWVIGCWYGEGVHFFKEQITSNRNTEEAAEILDGTLRTLHREHGVKYNPNQIKIYCDASGASRKTSASRSDTQILRHFGWRVMHNASNPLIRDRLNAVNRALMKSLLYIDPEGAPFTLSCIEQQGFDANGQPEKNGLDHATDAVGYCVAFRMPVIGRPTTSKLYA